MNDSNCEITSLACAILDLHKLDKIMILSEDDYFMPESKIVFRAIKKLYNSGSAIDLISVKSTIESCGDKIDDSFLAEIMKTFPVRDVDGLIKTLREYTKKRKILELKSHLVDFAEKNMSNDQMINKCYSHLDDIQNMSVDYFDSISNYSQKDISYYELNKDSYIETGFYDWDHTLSGLVNSELTILGARTGMGKSALALNIALCVSRKKNVLYISLEMITRLLVMRAISSLSNVDFYKLKNGTYDDKEMERLIKASDKLNYLNLSFIDDAFTLDVILSKIRKFYSMHKNIIVIIDYIQLIKVPWIDNKRLQVAETSSSLKQLCNKFDIPILALAQLTRNAENAVPRLSDLKEAGDLEQDADNVVLLHNTIDMGNVYNILFAKGRSSGTGQGKLFFDKKIITFKNHVEGF